MNIKVLKLIEKDARMTTQDIATITGLSEEEVRTEVYEMEKAGIIRGYKGVIDWEKVDTAAVSAIIELKVTPQFGKGFDQIAERFYQYEQVKTVYLMSGGYDIALMIEGRTLNEVAMFVAEQLSPMDTVVSTATHFVLKKYKQDGVLFEKPQQDERLVMMV